METHCNIRNSKGALSYTLLLINVESINKKMPSNNTVCIITHIIHTYIFAYVSMQMKNTCIL